MVNVPDHLLTILVPTFNRAKNLRELLDILVPALEKQPDVDLIVSNNGSSDNTSEVLRDISGLPRVRVVEQPINYGMHIHLAWLYGQATGKYLWMIGDDDLIEPDLLDLVCLRLQQDPKLGWIHLPHQFGTPPEPLVFSSRPTTDQRCDQGRRLFAPYVRWISFITANVMQTDLVQSKLRRLTFQSYYWPMSLLLMAVADCPAVVLSVCKIKAGPDITWGDMMNEVTDFQFPETIINSPVLTPSEKRCCLIQRYTDAPNHLDRLLLTNRPLFTRIVRMAPSLLNWKMLERIGRKSFSFVTAR